MPFSAVWLESTLFAILSSLIRVYIICHSWQCDQGLHYLPFSVWSGSTLLAILSSLIRVYTICHSQQSDQCLNCLPFSAVWSGSTPLAILNSLIKVQINTLILRNSLIRVYTRCSSEQSNQGLHFLLFSALWSGSTLFAILSLIRIYTICHSQQSIHCLHCHSQ